jgi:hypothetical protein
LHQAATDPLSYLSSSISQPTNQPTLTIKPLGLTPNGTMPPKNRLTSALKPTKQKWKTSTTLTGAVDAQVHLDAATPSRTVNKALQPKGRSPMKITKSKLDDTSVTSSNVMKLPTDANSTIKSDPKDSDTESKADSLNDMIASAQKELFKLTPLLKVDDDAITLATSKSKKWVPIKSAVKSPTPSTTHKKTTPTIDLTEPSNRRGATFAVDTNFKEREAQVAKRTPGKGTTLDDKLKECVAQIHIKILPGAEDIQETVLGLMQHCLTILQERDDTACFLNAASPWWQKK